MLRPGLRCRPISVPAKASAVARPKPSRRRTRSLAGFLCAGLLTTTSLTAASLATSALSDRAAAQGTNACPFVNTALSSTPEAYYQLNEASGSTAADQSGNTNNATITNASAYDQAPGPASCSAGALDFNGSSTDVVAPSAVTPTGPDFTAFGWFNLSTLTSTPAMVVANSHTNSNSSGFQLELNGSGSPNSGYFAIGTSGGLGEANWSQTIDTGQWYFYAGTYNGSTVTAYIDGAEVGTASTSGDVEAGPGDVAIGEAPTGAHDYFTGGIGDVGLYNSALTAVSDPEPVASRCLSLVEREQRPRQDHGLWIVLLLFLAGRHHPGHDQPRWRRWRVGYQPGGHRIDRLGRWGGRLHDRELGPHQFGLRPVPQLRDWLWRRRGQRDHHLTVRARLQRISVCDQRGRSEPRRVGWLGRGYRRGRWRWPGLLRGLRRRGRRRVRGLPGHRHQWLHVLRGVTPGPSRGRWRRRRGRDRRRYRGRW